MGSKSTSSKSTNSKLIKQKMLNDSKYAIGTAKQADNYNKTTNYLILHIWKTYKNGRDIANAAERQEPVNFELYAHKLQISATIATPETIPGEVLEVKHENHQYKIKYEAELQLHLNQKESLAHQSGESICILIWTMYNRPTAESRSQGRI